MADVNDAGNLTGKHKKRLEQVENADIDERDREAILAFHRHRRARGKKTTTLTADLSTLRCASERAEVPLVDMTKTDVEDLLTLLATPKDEGGYGLKPDGSGIFGYARVLRVFYRWLDGREDCQDYPFHDEIELPRQQFSPPGEGDLLTPDEVRALKDAAGRGRMNARDRALLAFLADGPRVTAAAQLRVGDVDVYDRANPTWHANDDAVGQKGLGEDGDEAGVRPFLWSAHEVRRWLSQGHPDAENPDAPLWTTQNYDPADPQSGALSPDGIRSMLKRAADRAGVEKRVNPHSFRHAAMTRARREGVDIEHLRVIAGWSDLRPAKAYDHVTDDERNVAVRESLGLPVPEDATDDRPPLIECWNCGENVEREERFCSACGQQQEISVRLAEQTAEGIHTAAGDIGVETTDPETIELAKALRSVTDPDNPKAFARLRTAVEELAKGDAGAR